MNKLMLALIAVAVSGAAVAKLPAQTDEAKAAAAAAKDKAAWSDKVSAYQLCMAQDKVALHYQKTKGGKKPSVEVPPCTNPGSYVAAAAAAQVGVADAKPVPAAGKPPTPPAK